MKKKVCILFGGKSTEYEISLLSTASVLNNLDREAYDVVTLGITKEGQWLLCEDDAARIQNNTWMQEGVSPAVILPDRTKKCILNLQTGEEIKIDVVFPVIHGAYGEDGTLQGLFRLAEIPFVGPGVLASALCLDKWYSKIVFAQAGIPQARCVMKTRWEIESGDEYIEEVEKTLGYPIFIKPTNTGSSVGITKAHNREELLLGIEEALQYDYKIIFEEFIPCREVETAVLGNEDPKVAVVGEVIPGKEFYDYEAKYQDDSLKIIVPAQLDEKTVETIREYARRAYFAAGCKGLSRVDFFLHRETGEIYLNEINTIPGFTDVSMYPMLFDAYGIPYRQLLSELIEYACV
jgi:D-alanine-D-alanine ligase